MKDAGEDAKKIGIMVASHNEDTVRFAIEKMKEIGISPEDKVICFGQLLGMCDYITFPLGMFIKINKYTSQILMTFYFYSHQQDNQDIQHTNIFHTAQSMKSFHISLDVHKKTKVY